MEYTEDEIREVYRASAFKRTFTIALAKDEPFLPKDKQSLDMMVERDWFGYDRNLELLLPLITKIINRKYIYYNTITQEFTKVLVSNRVHNIVIMYGLVFITLMYAHIPNWWTMDSRFWYNKKKTGYRDFPGLSIFMPLEKEIEKQLGVLDDVEKMILNQNSQLPPPPAFMPIVDYMIDSLAPLTEMEFMLNLIGRINTDNPSEEAKQAYDKLKAEIIEIRKTSRKPQPTTMVQGDMVGQKIQENYGSNFGLEAGANVITADERKQIGKR